MSELTVDRLKTLLRYNKKTGFFYWRVTRSHAVKGRIAGTISRGHRVIGVDGELRLASRLAWFYVKGVWPTNEVDHEDRNPLNDAWRNLRAATRKQNCENNGLRRDSTSGARGVHWFKRTEQWTAYINHNHVRYNLGYFNKKKDAIAARHTAERRLFTHSDIAAS